MGVFSDGSVIPSEGNRHRKTAETRSRRRMMYRFCLYFASVATALGALFLTRELDLFPARDQGYRRTKGTVLHHHIVRFHHEDDSLQLLEEDAPSPPLFFLSGSLGSVRVSNRHLKVAADSIGDVDDTHRERILREKAFVEATREFVLNDVIGFHYELTGSEDIVIDAKASVPCEGAYSKQGNTSSLYPCEAVTSLQYSSKALEPDRKGDIHLRFRPTVEGIPVDGASLLVHLRAGDSHPGGISFDGSDAGTHLDGYEVYGVNGQFVPASPVYHARGLSQRDLSSSREPTYNCHDALAEAAKQRLANIGFDGRVKWYDDDASDYCKLVYVHGDDGRLYKAWKGIIGYQDSLSAGNSSFDGQMERDILYADVVSKRLVTVHPQTRGALFLKTLDCSGSARFGRERCSSFYVTPRRRAGKTDHIGFRFRGRGQYLDYSEDEVLAATHNNTIDAYKYFKRVHDRDSLDDRGAPLISRVHWGDRFTSGFWDGKQMTYGDGDGIKFKPIGLGLDYVGHEVMHGITQHTSNLIYSRQSGALNEAMSDIFGACVQREMNKVSISNTFIIGEDVYIPQFPGDTLNNMADPLSNGFYDYFPDRYLGQEDNGGVHWNSGIANLAFVLMVQGGKHPRRRSNVRVTALDPTDFDRSLRMASRIFYHANTYCLTPDSNFVMARMCTEMFARSLYSSPSAGVSAASVVKKAWDAVGVPDLGAPTPLTDDVWLPNQSDQQKGSVRYYVLRDVQPYHFVKCQTIGYSGDADLYVRNGEKPVVEYTAGQNVINSCVSAEDGISREFCSTKEAVGGRRQLGAWRFFWPWDIIGGSSNSDDAPRPTETPTAGPTRRPRPTKAPTERPTRPPRPTRAPTERPTQRPRRTPAPTDRPTRRPRPTRAPTDRPTRQPRRTPAPTERPTRRPRPTRAPTDRPTRRPRPTKAPTDRPSRKPTESPTASPSSSPTRRPTASPTQKPTRPPTTGDGKDGQPYSAYVAIHAFEPYRDLRIKCWQVEY